ncbi:RsiV family protein [Kurthia sp. Dielmo]|uniref:RsiV family protein n=1 Tax=Kurthia sp. Dielmo TaxID=1033738 RepID=UPI00112428C4|nr:RsiV family protein [Kurthia sp. Dielmo]
MKKLVATAAMLGFMVAVPVQSIGAQAASAPKVSIKDYKGADDIQYAVIAGDKYKAVNEKMKKEAKKAYDYQAAEKTEMALKPIVKFKSASKVSILSVMSETADDAAHGNFTAISYNTINGKEVSLKSVFKSEKAYLNAKKYAKAKVLDNKKKYPLADKKTTIAGHSFYFTSTGGIKVVFDPYEVAPYADGFVTVSIPKSQLK